MKTAQSSQLCHEGLLMLNSGVDLGGGSNGGLVRPLLLLLLSTALSELTVVGRVSAPRHVMDTPVAGPAVDSLGRGLSFLGRCLLPCFILLLALAISGGLLVLGSLPSWLGFG